MPWSTHTQVSLSTFVESNARHRLPPTSSSAFWMEKERHGEDPYIGRCMEKCAGSGWRLRLRGRRVRKIETLRRFKNKQDCINVILGQMRSETAWIGDWVAYDNQIYLVVGIKRIDDPSVLQQYGDHDEPNTGRLMYIVKKFSKMNLVKLRTHTTEIVRARSCEAIEASTIKKLNALVKNIDDDMRTFLHYETLDEPAFTYSFNFRIDDSAAHRLIQEAVYRAVVKLRPSFSLRAFADEMNKEQSSVDFDKPLRLEHGLGKRNLVVSIYSRYLKVVKGKVIFHYASTESDF